MIKSSHDAGDFPCIFLELNMFKWTFIGRGSYNTALIDNKTDIVLKVPLKKTDDVNAPYRCVRIWNEINEDLEPKAQSYQDESFDYAWTCPYVRGIQASDAEIQETLLKIYTNTGRIVVDAPAEKNFLTTFYGKTICVDVAMALRLNMNFHRRQSLTSHEAWQSLSTKYPDFWQQNQQVFPKTVQCIKALLCIQNWRQDIIDVMFLNSYPQLIVKLSDAYDLAYSQSTAYQELAQVKPRHFDTQKIKIVAKLDEYILSRGSYQGDNFLPSLPTRLFRNQALTEVRTNHARVLQEKISNSHDIGELYEYLNASQHLHQSLAELSLFKSHFQQCLEDCLEEASFIEQQPSFGS